MNDTTLANRDQATLWNETSGPTWVELQAMLDRMLGPFAEVIVEEAFPGPGGRVLDVGCGAGATTLMMARRLDSAGGALGVDISAPLVAAARARAKADGVANVAFVEADAQTHAFQPSTFDAVISRFGVMFFDDPEAAFANIRCAAKPGAALAFVAWRSPAENRFMTTAMRAAAPHLPPIPPPAPDAPGQFGFADGARVQRILSAAGWSSVEVAPLDLEISVADKDLRTYVLRMGPVGAALRNLPEAERGAVVEAVEAAFAPYLRDGEARFDAACWKVTARA